LLLGRFGLAGVFWGAAILAFVWAALAIRPALASPVTVSG